MPGTLTALCTCLCGLFPGRETLTSFLALLKVIVEFVSHILDLLLTVLVGVHGQAGVGNLLPDHTSFILWLMGG